MRLIARWTLFFGLSCLGWVGAAARPVQIKGPKTAAQASGILIDINTASEAELRSLPGMGIAYVRRIVAGRPYTAKNQLVSRGVLPQEAYEKIQTRIIARRLQK